jgi:hypothetical protein
MVRVLRARCGESALAALIVWRRTGCCSDRVAKDPALP